MRTKGFYVTRRDGRLRYDYEVTWTRDDSRVVWEAKVTRGRKLKGRPHGHFLKRPIYPDKAVKAVIEHAIETLADIEK